MMNKKVRVRFSKVKFFLSHVYSQADLNSLKMTLDKEFLK